jgi:hypothetical protein
MLTPKKPRQNLRQKTFVERITIKVPPEQKRRFQEQANAEGLTESEYGRRLLFETSQKSDQQTVKKVGNIVVLIAQRIGISVEELNAIVKGKQ